MKEPGPSGRRGDSWCGACFPAAAERTALCQNLSVKATVAFDPQALLGSPAGSRGASVLTRPTVRAHSQPPQMGCGESCHTQSPSLLENADSSLTEPLGAHPAHWCRRLRPGSSSSLPASGLPPLFPGQKLRPGEGRFPRPPGLGQVLHEDAPPDTQEAALALQGLCHFPAG